MASTSTNNTVEGYLSLTDPETPERMKEIARRELGETEELKEKCLQQMKALINEHNVNCITRDDFLLRFLRTKKFSVQRAFDALQNYAHQRSSFHKRLMKLRWEAMENCLRHKVLGFFPYRDAEERLMFYFVTETWNSSICTDEEIAMTIVVLTNYAAEKESSQVTGILAMFDTQHVPFAHIPYVLRHSYFAKTFLFNCLPMRYKAFLCINEHVLTRYLVRLLEPFLPKKIRSRITIHGKTRDEFFQVFPRCLVPDEFGGTFGPLNNEHLIDIMRDYLPKMKEEQQFFLQKNH